MENLTIWSTHCKCLLCARCYILIFCVHLMDKYYLLLCETWVQFEGLALLVDYSVIFLLHRGEVVTETETVTSLFR